MLSTPGEPVNGGKPAAVAAKAAAIDAAQARPLTWKTVVKRALAVAVADAALYLALPKLIAVLGAWPRLSTLNPVWFTVCLAAELASFTCNFALQRLALRTKGWFPVVTAGLTGNAVTSSLPGGSAAGAAVQFRMLTTAGFDTDTAVGGLTAFSLLEVGGLLALPVFALPAIVAGVPVSRGLVHAALLGIAAFVLYAIFGVIVLRTDWPLATLGHVAQNLWNRITRGHRPPVTGLDQRLLAERDTIRAVLGSKWRQAAILTAGRLGFDYGCLLAALRATGASPQPSLVLLAYAADIVALFPLTPGGLGIVEASLRSPAKAVRLGLNGGPVLQSGFSFRPSYCCPWCSCWSGRGGAELCLVVVPSGACLVASSPGAPGVPEGLARLDGGQRQEGEELAGFGHGHAGQAGVPRWCFPCAVRELAGVAPVFGLVSGAVAGLRPGSGARAGGPGHRCAGRPGGRDGEQREGAHGQHGVAVEGVPPAELVLVKAGLSLTLLEALLHGPAFPRDFDQDRQGHRPGGVAVEERQVIGVGDLAADQQPVPRRAGRDHRPLVITVALAAPPAGAGLPAAGRDEPGQDRRVLAAGGGGDLEVDRDREVLTA